jgi:hypothetical protein
VQRSKGACTLWLPPLNGSIPGGSHNVHAPLLRCTFCTLLLDGQGIGKDWPSHPRRTLHSACLLLSTIRQILRTARPASPATPISSTFVGAAPRLCHPLPALRGNMTAACGRAIR